MTILVTGSAGHLGEALMRTLRDQGHQARGIDIKPSPFTNMTGSITDADFIRLALTGATAVIHAATLHKPHVGTHSSQDFVDTNVSGPLNLLEQAVAIGVKSFVFTSTTRAFGAALRPAASEPAAWVTEDVLLHRRVDIEDVVDAHLLALDKAQSIGFGRYIISATAPFTEADLADLRRDATATVGRLFPGMTALYAVRGWSMFQHFGRVYVNTLARRELGWNPKNTTFPTSSIVSVMARIGGARSPALSGPRAITIKSLRMVLTRSKAADPVRQNGRRSARFLKRSCPIPAPIHPD